MDTALARGATDILWRLVDDFDSAQPLLRAGGHDRLLRLVRDQGPVNATATGSAFR
eukprot:CAMPEP_0195151588 /NCGR_PEP_ID=MMETSP0448-20130528/180820_1 /TAXON_ID=66468 /ORGANISM="Heterocapsa triquestra, Strain CCMP 448" /LENGTH=55 /DNA_ID=CAMNT_0040190307 /DNA_START=9 /DNA_END=172 /DNA_ORIENTATION=+